MDMVNRNTQFENSDLALKLLNLTRTSTVTYQNDQNNSGAVIYTFMLLLTEVKKLTHKNVFNYFESIGAKSPVSCS